MTKAVWLGLIIGATVALSIGKVLILDPRSVPVVSDAISGVVRGSDGVEAGAWVIAETSTLPTRLIKIVATDDHGRYLIPQLPNADYRLWVRGYGLVDSPKISVRPGRRIDLEAKPAPTATAAAAYYPANYWQAMMRIPPKEQFPGGANSISGIGQAMTSHQKWESTAKSCLICHQVGNEVMRSGDSSEVAWTARVAMARPKGDPQMGLLGSGYANAMTLTMQSFGPRGIKEYSRWSTSIAKGALPPEAPRRPAGRERNAVITIWDWGNQTFIHDLTATDTLNISVNANGPVYGSEPNVGRFVIADPGHNNARAIDIADGLTHPMLVTMDRKGRVWFPTYGHAFLKESINDDLPPKQRCPGEWREGSRKGFVSSPRVENLRLYDPKTGKLETIPVCLDPKAHDYEAHPQDTLYFTSDSVISWIDTRLWDATHDPVRSQGWCPVILNSSGRTPDSRLGLTNGTLDHDQWNALGGAIDASKDTRMLGQFVFRARRNPGDDSIWITAYRGLPGGIIRIVPGSHPPFSCASEYFEPPSIGLGKFAAYGPMNIDFDSKGDVWVAFLSGNVGKFHLAACKNRKGPKATGQQCPASWSFRSLPGPRFAGTDETADFNYGLLVDKFDTAGLGRDTVLLAGGNSDSLVILPPGGAKPSIIRVPYPMGFYSRELSGRIDDPKAGWKGRAVWGSYNAIPVWHQEGGAEHSPGLVRFQIRPDALAY